MGNKNIVSLWMFILVGLIYIPIFIINCSNENCYISLKVYLLITASITFLFASWLLLNENGK